MYDQNLFFLIVLNNQSLHPMGPHYINDFQVNATSVRVLAGLREMGFAITGMAADSERDVLYWTLSKCDSFK